MKGSGNVSAKAKAVPTAVVVQSRLGINATIYLIMVFLCTSTTHEPSFPHFDSLLNYYNLIQSYP